MIIIIEETELRKIFFVDFWIRLGRDDVSRKFVFSRFVVLFEHEHII